MNVLEVEENVKRSLQNYSCCQDIFSLLSQEQCHSLIFPKAMERKRKCMVYIFSEQASLRIGKLLVVILFWNRVVA
ncbi:MAG: hypothetical protein ACJAZK_002939 [Psychroserpens sp.]|jgi:hypothetical protein